MPARKSPTSTTAAKSARAKAAAKAVATKPVATKSAVATKPVATKSAVAARPAVAKPAPAKPMAAKPAVAAKSVAVARPVAPKPVAAKPAAAKAPPAAERVMPADHKHFEGRLLEERARLLKELGYLEVNVLNKNPRDSSGDLSGYSFHMADAGTDAMEREKAFLFASSEGRALYDVDEALRRLYKGEYGMCDSCHKPIAPQRLEVVPHALLCITCKEKEEKAGRR
jgi:RNA polymerase-binding transcription factor DksA